MNFGWTHVDPHGSAIGGFARKIKEGSMDFPTWGWELTQRWRITVFRHISLFVLFKRPDIWFNHLDGWMLCIKLYTKRCIYYLQHATMVRLKNPFPCWHLLCFLINWGEGGEFHTVAEVWSVDAARALGVSERVWNRVCSIAMLGASKITDLFQWCSKGDFWQTCANPAFFALQSTFDI